MGGDLDGLCLDVCVKHLKTNILGEDLCYYRLVQGCFIQVFNLPLNFRITCGF